MPGNFFGGIFGQRFCLRQAREGGKKAGNSRESVELASPLSCFGVLGLEWWRKWL
jgi:hypothetical protein